MLKFSWIFTLTNFLAKPKKAFYFTADNMITWGYTSKALLKQAQNMLYTNNETIVGTKYLNVTQLGSVKLTKRYCSYSDCYYMHY